MFGKRGSLVENRKGQNVTLTTIILVVLGLVVLVFLILILVQGTGFIFRLLGIGESSQTAADLCSSLGLEGEGYYCQFQNEQERLDGVNQYYNCEHPNVKRIFEDDVDPAKIPDCVEEGFPTASEFCVEEGFRANTIVNGETCEQMLGGEDGEISCAEICEGTADDDSCAWVEESSCTGDDVSELVQDETGLSDDLENPVCCLASNA